MSEDVKPLRYPSYPPVNVLELVELAHLLLANVGWQVQPRDWVNAAERWREGYREHLRQTVAQVVKVPYEDDLGLVLYHRLNQDPQAFPVGGLAIRMTLRALRAVLPGGVWDSQDPDQVRAVAGAAVYTASVERKEEIARLVMAALELEPLRARPVAES